MASDRGRSINERLREAKASSDPVGAVRALFDETNDGWVALNLARLLVGVDRGEAIEFYRAAIALLPVEKWRETARRELEGLAPDNAVPPRVPKNPTTVKAQAPPPDEPASRVVEPPREALLALRQPLTDGERRVFEAFDSLLAPDWEIYVQPHLNGLRPDFVLLRPGAAIALIEVKDWRLSAREWKFEDGPLMARNRGGGDWYPTLDPVSQVRAVKDELIDLYLPAGSSAPSSWASISTVVVFTQETTEDARAAMAPFLDGASPQYEVVVGRDALDGGDLDCLLPEHDRQTSRYVDPEVSDALRHWLNEPSYSAEQRNPLELDAVQLRYATSRTETGYRRLRGPAGSGKTCILAARAAQLAAEGKRVLATTFNVTMLNYIRDMSVRWKPADSVAGVPPVYLHFHGWCKRLLALAGRRREYDVIWAQQPGPTRGLEKVLELVEDTLKSRRLPSQMRFDAILVDEGQDFQPDWWRALRRTLAPGGEMLLVADSSQDIYGRAGAWTDSAMDDAGFRGQWAELKPSYRLPRPVIDLAREFAMHHSHAQMGLLPEPPSQQELAVDPCFLRWVQVSKDSSVETTVKRELDAMLDRSRARGPDLALPMTDIVLLTDSRGLGKALVLSLGGSGLDLQHTFMDDYKKRRLSQVAFRKGAARAKSTTVHSFKGWESRALIVAVARGSSDEARALVYTALTRLYNDSRGSYLTVICSAPELEAFGRGWPEFSPVDTLAARPDPAAQGVASS